MQKYQQRRGNFWIVVFWQIYLYSSKSSYQNGHIPEKIPKTCGDHDKNVDYELRCVIEELPEISFYRVSLWDVWLFWDSLEIKEKRIQESSLNLREYKLIQGLIELNERWIADLV